MNVAPGNLALVVNLPRPWGGAICTITAGPFPAPRGFEHYGTFWQVEFPRPMPCHPYSSKRESTTMAMPDAHLRKIGGPDVDITEYFEAFDFGKERLPGALRLVTETQS